MALDGLEDAYERGKAMGVFAEQCVTKYAFTREDQDRFAIASTERALKANTDGSFAWEIAPVTVAGKGGEVKIDKDEQPFKAKLDKIPGLKPAFKKDGTITAANASSISDGAAALVLMRESTAEQARQEADRPHPRAFGACAGTRVVHDGADRRDQQGADEDRLEARRRGSVGSQRGLRGGDDGGDEANSTCRTTRSTSTAAPARSAIRSAPRAHASSSRCSAHCARPVASAAWRRSASAAARRPRWRWRCCDPASAAMTLAYGLLRDHRRATRTVRQARPAARHRRHAPCAVRCGRHPALPGSAHLAEPAAQLALAER